MPSSKRWVGLGKMVDCWQDGKTRALLKAALEYRQDFVVVREDTDLLAKAPKDHGCVQWAAWEGWVEGPPWEVDGDG
jgi:hypothetical protein